VNYRKWIQKAVNGDIDKMEGFAKLAEELGEVGKALNEESLVAILNELEHLEVIAMCYRNSIRVKAGLPLETAFREEAGLYVTNAKD
jgi:NTP pyrophosphatase (non-canonical NTP hydrolase)